ncbi:MAG: hypothetical protein KF774_18310 [Planctomyces sp.]|nr:hypothetical protein [Planctomyces sp.]
MQKKSGKGEKKPNERPKNRPLRIPLSFEKVVDAMLKTKPKKGNWTAIRGLSGMAFPATGLGLSSTIFRNGLTCAPKSS